MGRTSLFVYIKQMTGKELKQIFLDPFFLPDLTKGKKYCIQREREWGGRRREAAACLAGTRELWTISAPIVRRGRGLAVNGVRRAARGAVRRLSVIRANDGGRRSAGQCAGRGVSVGLNG